MKQVSMFLLLLATAFLSMSVVAEEVWISLPLPPLARPKAPERPKAEKLDGKDVMVRLYKWQPDPPPFEKVSVQLTGDSIRLDFNDISDSIVVVLGEDQKDKAAAKALGDCIYADLYRKGLRFSLSGGSKSTMWWTFTDALGNPIAGATVEIFVCMIACDDPRGCLRKLSTGEKGRLKVPIPEASLGWFNLIVSHPEYGIALVEDYYLKRPGIVLPLVRAGTKADQRCIRGIVVDPEGNPVSGASIGCNRAYTLGGGPIIAVQTYKVLSDELGAFSMYLPNKKNLRHDDRGDLIPPKSKYDIKIEPPRGLGLLPYEGQIENGRHTTITLERAEYFHTFAFEDENDPITDLDRLKKITLFIQRENKPELRFGYSDWKDGGMFPLGTYKATIEKKWIEGYEPKIWTPFRKYRFDPLEVTAGSPDLLVFKSPGSFLCCGRVIDGITGEPIPGVSVIAKSSIYGTRNLCQITPEQWQTLHALSANPSGDDENLAPLRKIYVFYEIVRADEDGWFQIKFQPGGKYYGLVVFEENYLGVEYHKSTLKPDKDNRIEIGLIKLFPSAKVIIETSAETPAGPGYPVIRHRWIIDKNDNPGWVSEFLSIEDDPEISFAYRQRNQNRTLTFPVPAELNMQIELRASWDRRWCPLTIPQIINLQQGQTLNLGHWALQPAIKICVKVIDSAGEPVEGVPVKYMVSGKSWSRVHNTDENGIAWLNVPPYSKGEFAISCWEEGLELKEGIAYEIGGEEDAGREFTMTLSDEMLYQLFK